MCAHELPFPSTSAPSVPPTCGFSGSSGASLMLPFYLVMMVVWGVMVWERLWQTLLCLKTCTFAQRLSLILALWGKRFSSWPTLRGVLLSYESALILSADAPVDLNPSGSELFLSVGSVMSPVVSLSCPSDSEQAIDRALSKEDLWLLSLQPCSHTLWSAVFLWDTR